MMTSNFFFFFWLLFLMISFQLFSFIPKFFNLNTAEMLR